MAFNASVQYNPPSGSMKVMVARQAAFPLWTDRNYGSAGAAQTYGITHEGQVSATTSTPNVLSVVGTNVGVNIGNTQNAFGGPLFANAAAPNCGFVPVGADQRTGPQEWLWVPNRAQILATINCGTVPGSTWSASCTLEQWVAPGEYTAVDPALYANTVTGTTPFLGVAFTVPVSGWYRIPMWTLFENGNLPLRVAYSNMSVCLRTSGPTFNAATTTWDCNIATTSLFTAFMPHVGPAEFANSSLPWASTRVTATAALWTNTTKALNKEGTVLWGRVNPCITDPFNVTETEVSNLHPAEKAYLGLQEGTYCYVPPSTDLAFFGDYRVVSTGSVGGHVPLYRLDNEGFVNVGFFTDSDGGSVFAMNLDWHIEFRTSSTLFQVGISTLPLETLHQAQVALLKAGFFYNNFNHAALVAKIISGLSTYAPLATAMTPIFKGISSSMQLSRQLHTSVKPTTVEGTQQRTTRKRRSRKNRGTQPSGKAQAKAMRKALTAMATTVRAKGRTQMQLPPFK